jgi:hypothetical protein
MDDLENTFARWRAAEPQGLDETNAGDDDAADAAFGALYGAVVPRVQASAAFATETMRVIAAVAVEDALRAKRLRRALSMGSVAISAVALYFGAGPALSLLPFLLVGALDVLVATVVWFVSSAERPDLWTVIVSMGRAAGAFVSDPKVTVALLALQGIAIAAFIALQRLLGPDPELFK